MSFKVKTLTRNPTDDRKRKQLERFFFDNIARDNDETSLETIPDGQMVRAFRMNEIGLYVLNDDDEIIAALYGTGAYTDAASASEVLGADSPLVTALQAQIMYIHQIAVNQKHRHTGLGSRLLKRALGLSLAIPTLGMQFLEFNNRNPGLEQFYVNNGFTIIDSRQLVLQFAGLDVGHIVNQDLPEYRYAVREIHAGLVKISEKPTPGIEIRTKKQNI